VRFNIISIPLGYHHDISTTISQYHEQFAQRKVCPCFIKRKIRRKTRKRVLEMQRVWTLGLTLQKERREKEKTNSPKHI